MQSPDIDPATHRLHADGAWLEVLCLEAPDPSAPTLVFLHEGLGCVTAWRDFPSRVAAATGCGALVYSRQGYGKSDPCRLPRPLTYMHDAACRELPAVLRAAAVGNYLLVGHSDGGSIALIHAGTCPQPGLLGVVTEAAHLFAEPVTLAAIHQARNEYRDGKLAERLTRHHGANTGCAFEGWATAWLDPGFTRWNIESCLPQIQVPILALQGSEDPYGTVAQLTSIRRQAGADVAIHLLPDCRHSAHRDQPERVLHLIRRFVRRLLHSATAPAVSR